MGLAIPTFVQRLLSPAAALPQVREPNRRWARGAGRSRLLRLTVAEVIVEAPSTRTIVFEDSALAYEAGQHLTLVVEVDGRTHRRCYSLSSSPGGQARPAITVKRVESGVVSNWLHDHVQAGDVLRASPASGRFVLANASAAARHLAMIAGGVGITPVISMAESMLRRDPDSRVTLLYGNRTEDEIVFRSRLEDMQADYPGRFQVLLALDRTPGDWKGLAGPLGGERVVEALAGVSVDGWFVCGPQAMMDSVVRSLENAGVAPASIHLERFQYAEPSAVAIPAAPATLVFAERGITATARVGATILEAAEEAGVALPSSCRMGGCGACKVKVEGRVVAAEPNCLTEAERAEGYTLACCSYGDGRIVLPGF